MYMKISKGNAGICCPGGAEGKPLNLQKCIYGLVQAARQWHTFFEEFILKQGFTIGEIDP
jgi:hypothetical protein